MTGTRLEPPYHNVAGNSKRDGLRTRRIGESAAKTLQTAGKQATRNVQRLRPYQSVPAKWWGNGRHPQEGEDIVWSVGKACSSLAARESRYQRGRLTTYLNMTFDGDTMSLTVVYSDEAVKETDKFLSSKKGYVGTDGRFYRDNEIDSIAYVLYNLTGEPTLA